MNSFPYYKDVFPIYDTKVAEYGRKGPTVTLNFVLAGRFIRKHYEGYVIESYIITVDYIIIAVPDGVWIFYTDGVKRFISNSWYVDINTDLL